MPKNNGKSKKEKKKARKSKKANVGIYAFGRGRIRFIGKATSIGSEQTGERSAIIVSSDEQNRSSTEVEVVFLTTKKKRLMPTHVRIDSALDLSIALCEQIQTVDKWRIKECLGTVTSDEMKKIDRALAVSLGLPGVNGGQLEDGVKPGEIRRGQVHRVSGDGTGVSKLVLVVSNDVGNLFSTIVEVVRLVPKKSQESPSQTTITLPDGQFTALCGKIQTMDKERLTEYIGTASVEDMGKINQAMAAGLELIKKEKDNISDKADSILTEISEGTIGEDCKVPA